MWIFVSKYPACKHTNVGYLKSMEFLNTNTSTICKGFRMKISSVSSYRLPTFSYRSNHRSQSCHCTIITSETFIEANLRHRSKLRIQKRCPPPQLIPASSEGLDHISSHWWINTTYVTPMGNFPSFTGKTTCHHHCNSYTIACCAAKLSTRLFLSVS